MSSYYLKILINDYITLHNLFHMIPPRPDLSHQNEEDVQGNERIS